MTLTRVHPGEPVRLEPDAPGSRERLLEWYAPPRTDWLRVNLVLSLSGSAAGQDGTSNTLTSATDRRILGVIRELSDVVLVGAQSVRAEGYQLPKNSRLAIVTASGDFSGHQFDPRESARVTVVCPSDVVATVRDALPEAEVLAVGAPDGRVPGRAIIEALREAGYRSIVCEGGPSLASLIIAAGLVDELCLTTSPVLRDSTPAAFAPSGLGEHPLHLEQLLVDDTSYLFARWMTRGRPASA